jgi:hypothetical protein
MKKQLSSIKVQQENLVDIRHKFSIIYKHIQSMHNELKYQAKIHTISKKLSKKKKTKTKFCIISPIFILFIYFIYFYVEKQRHKNNKIMQWEKR